ncbi:helix-turn-helix domain-containing protein [Seongchinamella sediminis]|uniref:Helix-turn-helix domain-containing protein n=1 Tax=Seongchinamella sediminis TaxID=2283635 RepID=A0A3L7DZ14_9GAMM|nr:AraC family transcriptional regulator [Seongchinamella sediminis]RLQ22504.1 helix-turn-helix domain-containing protein [Seongchinamella sediminis]
MSSEVHLVRSEVLAGFDALVRELGAAPEPFYRRVGLSSKLLANPDHLVPCESACELLDIAARQLRRPDFGLMMGEKRKLYQIGVLWPLVAHSPDVGEGVKAAVKHLHLHNRGMSWQLDVEGDRAWLTRTDRVATEVPTFQWGVYSTCSVVGILKALCGKHWRPSSVGFIHPTPEGQHLYNRFFGVEVAFNREFNSIVFPASDLSGKISDHNSSLYEQISRQVQALEDEYERQEDICSRMKVLIEQRMHTPACTQSAIAEVLSMHPKALQRALNAHGATFRELKAEVRLDMAERYLKDSEIPLTTIADILGFSELSSFSHAFKTRHKMSPAVWRETVKPGSA